MKKSKTILLLGMILTALFSVNAAAEDEAEATEAAADIAASAKDAEAAAAEMAEGYTIGVSYYDPEDFEGIAFREYFDNYLGTAFNAEFYYNSESIDSAEDEIAFVEELHEQGIQGIISFMSTYVEDVLPVCEEYGMYYICGSGTITEEVYDSVKDNPYFLGVVGPTDEDEEQAGEYLAEKLSALDEGQNASYLVVSGGSSLGNEMHRLRTVGILTKLQEIYGLTYDQSAEELAELSEETEISTGTDVRITILPGYLTDGTAVGSAAATGEYDMVISCMTIANAITYITDAEAENGYDIKVGMVDCFTDQNYAFFNEKDVNGDSKLNCLVGKYGAVVAPAFVAMSNAYAGYAEDFRDEGSAFWLHQTYWYAADTEEFNEQYALSIGISENTYSAADMMQVMKLFNNEADFDAYREFTEK
ncbi:MAG: hypothetical protein LUI07_08755 [Lachnospiraceae bacterium]|nr:hypothetical protein [Lachnospiraceae bacterium]